MKKKNLLCLLSVLTLLCAATGCGKKPVPPVEANIIKPLNELMDSSWEEIYDCAKQEGKVTFFVWHDEACYAQIGKAFEKAYPGVKFELVVSDVNAAVDKMVAEATQAAGSFDVAVVNAPQTLMDANALFGPIVDKLTNHDKLDKGLCKAQEGFIHNGYLAPLYRNQGGLLYNPRTVTDPPETWEELEAWIAANPKKFGFCHPLKGGSGGVFILSAIDNLCGGLDKYAGDIKADREKMENWDLMWNWFREFMKKMTVTSSNNDSLSRLNNGELDLVVAWDDGAYTAISNGELFKDAVFYIPDFGMPGGGDTIGILKNTQRPAASLLLTDFLTSDEAQTLINEYQHAYPGRTDIEAKFSALNADDLKNRTDWTPYCYKKAYIKGFILNVLLKSKK